MGKDEKIILAVAFVALIAVLIFHQRNQAAIVQATADNPIEADTSGYSYLTYNQPYMGSPPTAGILPTSSNGMLGQPEGTETTPAPYDCGCSI